MSIIIPNDIRSIGSSVFTGCSNLKYTEYNNGKYLGNIGEPYLILVDVIDTSVTSFTIPTTTKVIYYMAFYDCTSLVSITIPNSVRDIGAWAFYRCKLKSIVIPNSVTSIGGYAFGDCRQLVSIAIPSSVMRIDAYAFDNCNNLVSVYYGGTVSVWENTIIGNANDKLINANRYYYSETEPTDTTYNYWHYDENGEIILW